MSDIEKLFSLQGKTALITGASRGIGKTIAIGLARAGADIVVASRTKQGTEEVCDLVQNLGVRCDAFAVDVSNKPSIDQLYQNMSDTGIGADILINNAGVEQVCSSAEVDEALWDKIVDTNLKGAFFIAQGFARALLTAKQGGSIINLGSLTSAVGVPTATPYTSSKSGVLGMTRALSTEWSSSDIRVNAIGPGYFRTELTEAFYQDEQWHQTMLTKIPMQRFGSLEDLVGVSVFLAGDSSAYISGQIFYIDGGYLAAI